MGSESGMGIVRKTEITAETHRSLSIKRGHRCQLAWCEECGRQVQMVIADDDAILAGISPREIYQLIETHELHFAETPDGIVFICLSSLRNLVANRCRDRSKHSTWRRTQK